MAANTTHAANTTANATKAANATKPANLTVSHTSPASKAANCKSDIKYSDIEYISLILRHNASSEPFFDHCYDLKYLDKNRALHWLDGTIDQCNNGKEGGEKDVCEALKCVKDDDKDALAESIATSAAREADACNSGNTTASATTSATTKKNLTDQAKADKETLYDCLTNYAFFDKYEQICKDAKLNAMVEGSYNVTSC